jgi:hypothetical protein
MGGGTAEQGLRLRDVAEGGVEQDGIEGSRAERQGPSIRRLERERGNVARELPRPGHEDSRRIHSHRCGHSGPPCGATADRSRRWMLGMPLCQR